MRLVHRACLEEWRLKTTNPANRPTIPHTPPPRHGDAEQEARGTWCCCGG
eukprot:gene33811-38649_t